MYFCIEIFQKQIEFPIFLRYIVNILICCGISFFMYYNKSWGAGDAKLYFTIVFLMPYNLFVDNTLNLFPGFVLLVLIFGISFLYLIAETIVLVFKDFRQKKIKKDLLKVKGYSKRTLINFAYNFIFSYFLCSVIIELAVYYIPNVFLNNRGLFMFVNIIIITISLNYFQNNKILYAVIVLITTYVFLHIFLLPASQLMSTASISSIAVLLIIIFLRYLGSRYNYVDIAAESVKEGMVLSFDTILKFKSSRIKGLPEFTTESTDTRISLENAESIKRWGKSNQSSKTIKVVKHIPFAPFICFGTLIFLLIRLYMFLNWQGR